MTKGSLVSGSIPAAREGHRRRFSATDKRQILEEAMRLGARLSAVAPLWDSGACFVPLEAGVMPAAAPTFVAVEITDADQERGVRTSCPLYPQ